MKNLSLRMPWGNAYRTIVPVLTALLAVLFTMGTAGAADEKEDDSAGTHFVVIYPGGPAPSSSGQEVIGQFLDLFSGDLGQPVAGHYFNEMEAAIAFVKEHPNSFVMGTTGFFLTHREELGLAPLAAVTLPDREEEQYFVVVKAGAAAKLDDLRGTTLAGQPLYESPDFLNRIVFAGQLDVTSDLTPEPTGRPLSALRKVLEGELGAVILNGIQYDSLKTLPFAEDLETIFESTPIFPVSFCMRDTESNRALEDAMLAALMRLSETEDGKEACETFGIAGFQEVDEEKVTALIETYEATE